MARFKSQRAAAPTPTKSFASVDDALGALVRVVNAHDEELKKLNGGLTLGENTSGIIKELDIAMPVAPPWRTDCCELDGFLDSAYPISALMEPGGRVTLRGGVTPKPGGGGLVPPIPPLQFLGTMDVGYRPEKQEWRPIVTNTNSWGVLLLAPNGVLQMVQSGIVGGPLTASLDGISYFAGSTEYPAAAPHQFTGGTWPIIVEHGFKTPCTGAWVLGFRLEGNAGQNVGKGAPVLDWEDLGDGTLRLNGVWGLQWGRRYKLRLYLTPEKET